MAARGVVQAGLAILLLAAVVKAYPTGAPVGACASLNPDTHGPSSATGSSPYVISFSSHTYRPNDVIKVTLSGGLFKGFLIEGRKADGSSTDPVGFFQNPVAGTQLLCTSGSTGNGLTHTNNTVKSNMSFEWKAPSSSVGDIVFHHTVVRGGAPSTKVDPADYYMDVKSSPLRPATKRILQFEKEIVHEIAVEVDEDGKDVIYALPSFAKILRGERP